jgi:hypothetical protein
VANVEDKLRLQVQTARLVADAAARIKFENTDKDNFLLIVAPVDGVITDVTSTQPGDKIQANAPLGGIAPKNARPILKIEMAEHDRAFLREGFPVQLKFNAFPYQRYGTIRGTLQYISPATKPSLQTRQPVYEGRVTLEQDQYKVGDAAYPLRYGMTAVAEWCESGQITPPRRIPKRKKMYNMFNILLSIVRAYDSYQKSHVRRRHDPLYPDYSHRPCKSIRERSCPNTCSRKCLARSHKEQDQALGPVVRKI